LIGEETFTSILNLEIANSTAEKIAAHLRSLGMKYKQVLLKQVVEP
jgi:hypothetical protein